MTSLNELRLMHISLVRVLDEKRVVIFKVIASGFLLFDEMLNLVIDLQGFGDVFWPLQLFLLVLRFWLG